MRIGFGFRPQFWPSLIALPAILVMVGLSFWQIERLQWKEGLIAEREARIAAAPLARLPAGADLGAAEYRRIRLAGVFRHDREFYAPARSQNGNVGLWVLTPFQIADGDLILVNRGWVPAERADPKSRAEGLIAGPIEIEGILRLPQKRSWPQPENEPEKNRWFYIAPQEIEAFAGIGLRRDLYLDAVKSDVPGGFPIGGQTRIALPNDHLQYAITWGVLALALGVIYILYHAKNFPRPSGDKK